jgi:hypothetical protein
MGRQCRNPKCNRPLTGRKTMWCDSGCRNAASRAASRGATVISLPKVEDQGPLSTYSAFKAALDAAGRLDTPLGQLALSHAALLNASVAVMGRAALAKELRETFVEAMKDADHNTSALDEINESAAAALELIRGA